MNQNIFNSKLIFLTFLLFSSINLTFIIYLITPFTLFNRPNQVNRQNKFELNIDNNSIGIFHNQSIIPPKINNQQDIRNDVFGEATSSGEKRIYVNLTTQLLSAYQDDNLYFQTPISSGKWGRTPTGEFTIWSKFRATRMTGGSGSTYYDLPNVEYTMFFHNHEIAASRGFALHGAYWHNNFGHPMSHGCINMRNIDAKKLYEWANPNTTNHSIHSSINNPGTKIIIYGEASDQ